MSNADDLAAGRRFNYKCGMALLIGWLGTWAAIANSLAYWKALESYWAAYDYFSSPAPYGAYQPEKIPAKPTYWMQHDVGVDFWMKATLSGFLLSVVFFMVVCGVIVASVVTFTDDPRPTPRRKTNTVIEPDGSVTPD